MKEIRPEVKEKHEQMLWTVFACAFLGVWLIFSHFAFGYGTTIMGINDMITGGVILLASIFALKANRFGFFCLWLITFAGLWLNFAPLLFHAKHAVEYLNDTAVGILVVLFSLIIPGLPGKVEEVGHEIPPGWSYNPSSWLQRLPVIKLGIVGMFISRYLAAYQLGYIDTMFDPAFGDGTVEVITSKVASFFPVPDAGLGCFAYTLEVLLGLKGGQSRWRTMPWMVISFVFLVVPLGIVSIVLVILQPLLVGAWCFLCLCTATAMMIMIVFAVDELIAVFQFLHLSVKAGNGFWKTFWHGGDLPGTKDDAEEPFSEVPVLSMYKRAFMGVGWCWNLYLSAAVGVALIFFPFWFNFFGFMRDVDHLVGSLIVVCSILSLAEVIRTLRFINIAFGLFIAIVSWFFPGPAVYHTLLGIALILLSLGRGKIKESYGSWQKMIK